MVASTSEKRLRRCVNVAGFPASRDDLLHAAGQAGCDEETLRALQAIPSQTYTTFAQVCASLTLVDEALDGPDHATGDDQPGARR